MSVADKRKVALADRRSLVFKLLLDGQWHSTSEIESPACGGSQGTRRVRELRAGGAQIVTRRRAGHDDYEYRMTPPSQAKPGTQAGIFTGGNA